MSATGRPRGRSYGPNRLREPRLVGMDEKATLHETVQHGASAGHLAEYAETVLLPEQEGKIRRRMFAAIDSDEPLDARKAVEAWVELRSAYRLVKTLRDAQKAGETAHEQLSAIHDESEQSG